ncbi:hypothetical protein Barb4_00784 [Bacteroidales bacterium Barb4]|nr:hypothetical protein Barb4_00784 [Bacteroidales bacterium Barb4]
MLLKDNLLCTPDKRILWLSKTCDGYVHDKKIMNEQPLNFPSGITLWQDTDFLGHKSGNATVKVPMKKPKGKQLSETQKKRRIRFSHSCRACHRRSQKNVVLSKSISDAASLALTI